MNLSVLYLWLLQRELVLNNVTPQLAAALDRAKVSDRNATYILTEAANSLNYNTLDININRSSIRRQRKACRSRFVASIKKDK